MKLDDDATNQLLIECKQSKQCAPAKHHFDDCVERVQQQESEDGAQEDCVEECTCNRCADRQNSTLSFCRQIKEAPLTNRTYSLPPGTLRYRMRCSQAVVQAEIKKTQRRFPNHINRRKNPSTQCTNKMDTINDMGAGKRQPAKKRKVWGRKAELHDCETNSHRQLLVLSCGKTWVFPLCELF